jgi:hypothetical protein
VWIVAIALSSPTFKILVNISLFVNMFSMKWPGSDGNERKYIVNHGNIYHKLAKSSVKSGQHLPWTGKISREMKAICTLDWQTIIWNDGNIYLELAKSSVKSGQHLPWAGKIVREIRATSTLSWQNRPWNKGDIYHELAKSSVKSGQTLSLTLAQRRYYILFLTWKEGVLLWSLHLF